MIVELVRLFQLLDAVEHLEGQVVLEELSYFVVEVLEDLGLEHLDRERSGEAVIETRLLR